MISSIKPLTILPVLVWIYVEVLLHFIPYLYCSILRLIHIMEGGLLQREVERMHPKATCVTQQIMPLSLENTFTAPFVLGVGMLLSLFLLLMEKFALYFGSRNNVSQAPWS